MRFHILHHVIYPALSSYTQFTTNNNENLVELSLNVTNTPASTLTETSILYTDKHLDTQMDRQTSSFKYIPPPPARKHSFRGGITITGNITNYHTILRSRDLIEFILLTTWVTSISYFSNYVFYPVQELQFNCSLLRFVIC